MHACFLGQFICKMFNKGLKAVLTFTGLTSKAIFCKDESLLSRFGWQKGLEVLLKIMFCTQYFVTSQDRGRRKLFKGLIAANYIR